MLAWLKSLVIKENRRDQKLADMLKELLNAMEDGRVTKDEMSELRRRAYDILIEFNLDKKDVTWKRAGS